MNIIGKKIRYNNPSLGEEYDCYVAAFDIRRGITLKRIENDKETFCINLAHFPAAAELLEYIAATIESEDYLDGHTLPLEWDNITKLPVKDDRFSCMETCYTK